MKVRSFGFLACLLVLFLKEGRPILRYPWGVNFRKEGTLHHSVDRVWVVVKVPIPTYQDLDVDHNGFRKLRQMCPKQTEVTPPDTLGPERIMQTLWVTSSITGETRAQNIYFQTNLTHALCERIEPLIRIIEQNEYKAQSKIIQLLQDDLDLILKGNQHRHRDKRAIGAALAAIAPTLGKVVTPIIGGVAMMAVEKIGSWLSGKRHKAVRKGLEYLDRQQGLQRNQLYDTQEDLVMVGRYSAAALDRMAHKMQTLQDQQTQIADWVQKSFRTYRTFHRDLLMATQMQTLLQYTREAHGEVYQEMIERINQFLDATITLTQGYLPRELITPSRLRRMVEEVERKVKETHPNFQVALKDPNDYYDMKLVTFGTKDKDLVITFPVFLQHGDRQTLELYQVETVPVPVQDVNDELDTFTQVIPKKPYIAVAGQYFIELTTSDLLRCKKIHFQFYCEELFMVRHEDRPTCNSALMFENNQEVVLENCKIKVMYNATVRPAVLDGGDKIILANMAKDKQLLCTLPDPIAQPLPEDNSASIFPRRLPAQTYLMMNREVLCYCDIEADYHLVLQSIAGCPDSNEPIVYEYTVNQAFYGQFKELLNTVNFEIEETSMVSETPFPEFPIYLPVDEKLVDDPNLYIDQLQDYLNKTVSQRRPANRPLDDTSLREVMKEGFLDNVGIKIFNFVTGCMTVLMVFIIACLILHSTYLKTMVGGLAMSVAPKGEAQVLFKPTIPPTPRPTVNTQEVYQLICHDPWIQWTITTVFVLTLIVSLIKAMHKVVITKGIVYTNKCEIYLVISQACYYIPVKVLNTRGILHNFSIDGKMNKAQIQLNKNTYSRDSLSINWNQKVYNKVNQLNLPGVVQIPFWYKAMARDMLSKEDISLHLMVKQGYNWCQVREAIPPLPSTSDDTYATIG